jgi:4,5-dihydroxyphthalate decarboxylase
MVCAPYDRAQALINGVVKPEGIELDIHVISDDVERQSRAIKGEFDIAEFFTGRYIADVPYRSFGFTAIPIFVKRMFRHSYIYISRRKNIRSPSDLNGKRIGIQNWFTTTALWARGILEEEYGVDLKSITWVPRAVYQVGDWKAPSWLKLEPAPKDVSQHDLLKSGLIDAGITTETWAPFDGPDIDFLFPNYAQLERDYFKRTGFFPIMHTLLIKRSVLNDHPWVAMSVFNAWEESKKRCYDWLEWQRIHQTSLWYRALWEEERATAGPDIYTWGFQKTKREVDKMLEYSYSQGLTSRKLEPEELFYPTTLNT